MKIVQIIWYLIITKIIIKDINAIDRYRISDKNTIAKLCLGQNTN